MFESFLEVPFFTEGNVQIWYRGNLSSLFVLGAKFRSIFYLGAGSPLCVVLECIHRNNSFAD